MPGPQYPYQVYSPYKFRVYRNSAWTDGNAAFVVVNFDTRDFDTSSNVDITTNKGRFTAPIAGFYMFSASVATPVTSGSTTLLELFKNSTTEYLLDQRNAGANNTSQSGSALLQLAVNDFIEVRHFGTGGAGLTGSTNTYFSGYLVSIV